MGRVDEHARPLIPSFVPAYAPSHVDQREAFRELGRRCVELNAHLIAAGGTRSWVGGPFGAVRCDSAGKD